ncbi:hypothetical protein HYPSUDRAFT_200342 [Hypholoma sublateritium FD-334 SS-4]|uniref:Uncharacterized protein n=1 Tax=Hypholoma sublateritium (strain FD-334 SS-4) TaxID=945553 RepID=A0A0D2MLQ8_HYPSF|nr:hypothetical protein HYPSUDRAFT_200342 [Hypholoma sublateritium FD-334 SS-4]
MDVKYMEAHPFQSAHPPAPVKREPLADTLPDNTTLSIAESVAQPALEALESDSETEDETDSNEYIDNIIRDINALVARLRSSRDFERARRRNREKDLARANRRLALLDGQRSSRPTQMPYDQEPPVDWSRGRVFVRNGTIFCSPNSQRTVFMPDESLAHTSPFHAVNNPNPPDIQLFQPVWWDWSHGWLAFVPLSPSFLALPFKVLSWKPRILEHLIFNGERRFQVHCEDSMPWFQCQQQLKRMADELRMHFHIPGNLPPLPLSFGLDLMHKSRNDAEKAVDNCRRWFVVWMGYLSYAIAQTSRPEYLKPVSGPLPCWYEHLATKNFGAAWLDGLSRSTVGAFDTRTTRSGVILNIKTNDHHQPPVQWFLAHNIPCWYALTKQTEEYMNADPFLRRLIPPFAMVQAVLTDLLAESRLPLIWVIIHGYGAWDWAEYTNQARSLLDMQRSPTMIGQLLSEQLGTVHPNTNWELVDPTKREETLVKLKGFLSERENNILSQIKADEVTLAEGMVDRELFDGASTTLFKHWTDFFAKRAAREEELLKAESSKDRQARLARERNPPTKKCQMYLWSKVQTTGGESLYARTLQPKRDHSSLVTTYCPAQTKFYARKGDWDFFEEFDLEERQPYDDLLDPDSEPDLPHNNPPPEREERAPSPLRPNADLSVPTAVPGRSPSPILQQDEEPIPEAFYLKATVDDYSPESPTPRPEEMDTVADSDTLPEEMIMSETRILERVYWQFGFVPPLGKEYPPAPLQWSEVLHMLGHVGEDPVSPSDKLALQAFFYALVRKEAIPEDLDDLSTNNRSYLLGRIGLQSFSVLGKYFVFWGLHSATTDWLLGVDSAAAVLYILRVLASADRTFTSLTLGHLLVQNGVRFYTFLQLPHGVHYGLEAPFKPAAYRRNGYNFTAQDFEEALLETRALVRTHQGRAALLRGGIIGRIAREFLDTDDVLDGPSLEATYCRHGLCVNAEDGEHELWDDDLTENEIATICGTYLMYTGSGEQTTKVSWFPPPHTVETSSYDSVEWTPKAEALFQKIFDDAKNGTFQPLNAKKWRHVFRDLKNPRVAFDNNRSRAHNFLVERKGPIGGV